MFLIGCQILVEGLTQQIIHLKCLQLAPVLDCPFVAIIEEAMTQAESIDLLFDLLECQFVVIPHTEIFFYRVILIGGNMNRMIPAIAKTLSDHVGITCIRLHPLALRG